MFVVDELIAASARLKTPRARVALGCLVTEHMLDIYRCGNMKYRVADVSGLPADLPPDRDAIELGLEQAWRFAAEGQHDPAITKPLLAMLQARPYVSESKQLSLAANGPIYGLIDTLLAIEDPSDHALQGIIGRPSNGVGRLAEDQDSDEEQPNIERRLETAWQVRAAEAVAAQGDGPYTRDQFREVLAEELPWRRYLDGYTKKWSAIDPNAPAKKKPRPKQK